MQENSRKERERLAREEDILNAAEKQFGSLGVEGTSMEGIAAEAQFTRKTVYQYFGNKDELLSAVIIRGFRLLFSQYQAELKSGGSGYERLRSMGRLYYRFYKEHTGFFNLINHAGRIKSMGKEAQREEFAKLDDALFRSLAAVIEAGKADGSIRRDVDTVMGTASAIFTITGFFYEFSITGKSFTGHLSLDEDRFVEYTLDLLLEGFRG